jgi:hypothetical protein
MVHTRKPPYEQLLVGVVAGGVSSFHPSSTPQAVAQGLEAGGALHGWCWGLQGVVSSLGHRGGSWGCPSSWWGPGVHSSSSSVPAAIHSPYPTCKQVLAAVGMGGGRHSPFGGVCARQHDVARVRGMLGPLGPVPRRH